MRRWVLLAFLPCLSTLGMATEPITFEQLQSSAYQHSHRLRLRVIDTSIEKARLQTLYSTLYPQLSVGYNGEYNQNLDTSTTGSLMVGDTTINSTIAHKDSVALRLNYELYHFGTTSQQIQMSHHEIEAKRLEACNEAIKLSQEILDHYVQGEKLQNDLHYKHQMYTLQQERYHLTQRLYAAQKESRISLGNEAIQLLEVEQELHRAQMGYEEHLLALTHLSHVELTPQESHLSPLNTPTITIRNFQETPQAHQYQERINAKKSEISLNVRTQLPTLSVYSNYYLYGSAMHNATDAFTAIRPNSWNVGLSLRWSIFEGFKYTSESTRLHLEYQHLLHEYALAQEEFETQTKTQHSHIHTLSRLIQTQTNAVKEQYSNLTMTQRLKEQGETDALSAIRVHLDTLEKERSLSSDRIQNAYEAQKLHVQHTHASGCTLW
ncbi:MAG: TolC family protein [Sulfuricurvum sp.]